MPPENDNENENGNEENNINESREITESAALLAAETTISSNEEFQPQVQQEEQQPTFQIPEAPPELLEEDIQINNLLLQENQQQQQQQQQQVKPYFQFRYTSTSLYSALLILWYTLRTRREFYPAMLYLSSSKLSYVVFGNAIVALSLSVFHFVCHVFLNGLRSAEKEAIRDGMRWSMTETCLALTMFREEVSVNMGIMFLLLILFKCWHWAAELRGKHLIQTEEAVIKSPTHNLVYIPYLHLKYIAMVWGLLFLDISAVAYCVWYCAQEGPSVHILFGFEGVVLAISAITSLNLYYLHALDGAITIVTTHETLGTTKLVHFISSCWKDYRFTLNLTVDLLSYSAKFLSYLLFFFIVFTYYGMPFNIFREVYISCQELRKKMIQFANYRRLSTMLENFYTCTTQEELDEAGGVDIISRDTLSLHECPKKLPVCGHVFHKYTLKGWLMQQTTCPTCRRDILAAVKEEERLKKQQQKETVVLASAEEEITAENLQTQSPTNTNATPIFADATSDLPALYQVRNTVGADVVPSRTQKKQIMRTIPYNKVVVCTHEQTWTIDGTDTVMMQMPLGGWVQSKDLVFVKELPLFQTTPANTLRDPNVIRGPVYNVT